MGGSAVWRLPEGRRLCSGYACLHAFDGERRPGTPDHVAGVVAGERALETGVGPRCRDRQPSLLPSLLFAAEISLT